MKFAEMTQEVLVTKSQQVKFEILEAPMIKKPPVIGKSLIYHTKKGAYIMQIYFCLFQFAKIEEFVSLLL